MFDHVFTPFVCLGTGETIVSGAEMYTCFPMFISKEKLQQLSWIMRLHLLCLSFFIFKSFERFSLTVQINNFGGVSSHRCSKSSCLFLFKYQGHIEYNLFMQYDMSESYFHVDVHTILLV